MIVRQILFVAIILSTAIFTLVGAALNTTVAVIAAALGAIWLFQELTGRTPFSYLCFGVFTAVAALGAFGSASVWFLLLGISAALVAWDLSRFRRRLREEEADDYKTQLERAHLQKLGTTVALGLLIAVVPAILTISLNFVVLLALMLIALLALRFALLSLRGEQR